MVTACIDAPSFSEAKNRPTIVNTKWDTGGVEALIAHDTPQNMFPYRIQAIRNVHMA